MSRATQSFKTGMSFISGAKVPAYTLEYLSSSPGHPEGSYETIVVPYIEIGRSSKCAVRFSEEVGTVSRYHAAFLRRGEQIFVKNLSNSNPTLVNGSPIAEEWQLKNGDEVQFSYEGPKVRFNTTQSQTVKTPMGITQRIGLVVNQAVRPYRTAVISLLLLIVLGSAAFGYFIFQLNEQTGELADQTQELKGQNASLSDSLAMAVRANQELRQKLMQDRQKMEVQLQATVAEFKAKQQKLIQEIKTNRVDPEEMIANAIADVKGSVFYMGIKNVKAEMEGEVLIDEPFQENCHCTGFLLEDGRFVTARHCIEMFLYKSDELNLLASLGGTVTYDFYAVSSDERLRFDFTNHDFKINRSTDYYEEDEYNGQEVMLRKANAYDGTDWAYLQTNTSGSIKADPALSANLKTGTELHCLGYTYGNTFQEFSRADGLEVLYSKASVAKDKLDNNTIVVSGYGFDNGNSGGPLFVIKNGEAKAVAIVSAGYMNPDTGRDDALGSVVPIKNLSN